ENRSHELCNSKAITHLIASLRQSVSIPLSHYVRFHARTLHDLPIPPLFPYTTLFRSNYGLATQWMSFGQQGFHLLLTLSMLIFLDRKSTRLNSSHEWISYAVFCLKKKKKNRSTAVSNKVYTI